MNTEVIPFQANFQLDRWGRRNPSTTVLVRTREFRERVREGRKAVGRFSVFVDDPQRVFDSAVEMGTLAGLTEPQREVLQLRFRDGMSQLEVAATLGRKPRAVSKIERVALGKLEGTVDIGKARHMLEEGKIPINSTSFLTDLERKVLALYYQQNLTLTEISKALDRDVKRVHEVRKVAVNKIAHMYLPQNNNS